MMAGNNNRSRMYKQSDIEGLSERSRRVLLTIGVQTGVTSPKDNIDTPSGLSEQDVVTTSTVREPLNLDNDTINYELRKLGEDREFSVEVPLITTYHRDTDSSGKPKPKRVELTEAGRQALSDGVVAVDSLDTGPVWFPDNGSTEEQLHALARRLDTHETLLDEVAVTIGLERVSAALAATEREDQEISLESTADLELVSDQQLIETVEKLARGNKAIKRALEDAGINATKYLD